MSPTTGGEHQQQLESILDQWQRELSRPAFGAVTEALAEQFGTGLAGRLAEAGREQRAAARMPSRAYGVVAEALGKQFSTGLTSNVAGASGSQPAAATRRGAVAADALRPKTIRFAEQLLETPDPTSLVRLHAFELEAGALARVEVAAAVSVAADALGDSPAVEAIGDAAAGLDGGPLADVATSRDWPLLVLLLATLYYGVSATLVAEDPESGTTTGRATESLALALLVVLAYADRAP